MKKDNLDKWFEEQRDCFDLAEPNDGHRERFLDKLNANTQETKVISLAQWWKPLAVAASIVLIVMVTLWPAQDQASKDLAAVSPEMAKTEDFFTVAIEQELYKINEQRTPQTKQLVQDALTQLEILENDYESLREDLAISGDDSRVIHAMITNFQNRINLLNDVLEEIKSIKKFNNTNDESKLL